MLRVKLRVVTAVALLTFPLLLSAQKPAKPPAPGGTVANPAIAYEASSNNGLHDLMVMDANGQNQTRLVRGGNNLTPRWSPDGEWIAFARTSVATPGIYMIRRNGTGLCRIVATSGLFRFGDPTWSPQRDVNGSYNIIYVDRAPGVTATDLFGVEAVCGATNPQRLTDTPTLYERHPAWSADNILAAAVGAGPLHIQLFDIVLDSAGGMTISPGLNLTRFGPLAQGEASFPLWTADRTELIVSGSDKYANGVDDYDLWLISATSPGVATRLNRTPTAFEMRPTWSPSFTKLAFDNGFAIYTVDVSATDGSLSQPTLLLNPKQGSVSHPSWRPVQ